MNTNYSMEFKTITVSSPGRICLLDEHQDYFGLPIMSAAINRRIRVEMQPSGSDVCTVECPDTNEQYEFSLSALPLAYAHKRDYIRSVVNILHRRGVVKGQGFKAHITGTIPMRAGVSSSSALCVVWGAALSVFYGAPLDAEHYAYLGHEAEVKEFKEPGGMMDHLSSAYGGMIYIDFKQDPPVVKKLPVPHGDFVLGDSLEPKATIEGILRIKNGTYSALNAVKNSKSDATLATLSLGEAQKILSGTSIDRETADLLLGTLATRDITQEGYDHFARGAFNDEEFGNLIDRQHAVLRDLLKISTPKIERMITAAKSAGALGCKITGSGGGGCMLAYAPGCAEKVARAIENVGGKATDIMVDQGVRVE
jgi:galactokinase